MFHFVVRVTKENQSVTVLYYLFSENYRVCTVPGMLIADSCGIWRAQWESGL